jgi:ribonuclease HI
MINVYTDGGCLGNPGRGAWAYVFRRGGSLIRDSGVEASTTNNRMELQAVIKALERIDTEQPPSRERIEIFTDSIYVKRGITEWILRWVRNGWKTASKKPVKNRELWVRLLGLQERLDVGWNWVQGHSGDELNEMCDSMVKERMSESHETLQ